MELGYRFVARIRIRYRRMFVAFVLKLWVKKITGLHNVPSKGPLLIVSNHVSYADFLILAAVLDRSTLFVAASKLKNKKIVNWFLKLNTMVYLDQNNPGYSFFKKIIYYLRMNRSIVIYPEGTRSRSGDMLLPKLGFVKLAMMTGVQVLPVAMKGTFEILPPQRIVPKFKRCEVTIDKPIYLNKDNLELRNFFYKNGRLVKDRALTPTDLQNMAIQIMNKIRLLSNEKWDSSALDYFKEMSHNNKETVLLTL